MFGKRLEELRTRAALTQENVAEALDISATLVSLWEHDKRTPRRHRWPALAKLYQVPYVYIVNLIAGIEPTDQTIDLTTYLSRFPEPVREFLLSADPRLIVVTERLARRGLTPEQFEDLAKVVEHIQRQDRAPDHHEKTTPRRRQATRSRIKDDRDGGGDAAIDTEAKAKGTVETG